MEKHTKNCIRIYAFYKQVAGNLIPDVHHAVKNYWQIDKAYQEEKSYAGVLYAQKVKTKEMQRMHDWAWLCLVRTVAEYYQIPQDVADKIADEYKKRGFVEVLKDHAPKQLEGEKQ